MLEKIKQDANGLTLQQLMMACTGCGIHFSKPELDKLISDGFVRNDEGIYKATPKAWQV